MPLTVKTLIQICLFRAKPQDLPASINLLVSTAIVATILFIVRNNHLAPDVNTVGISIAEVLLLGLGLKILLALFSKPERWLQSATALLGCSAVLSLAILPFFLMTGDGDISVSSNVITRIAIVGVSIWDFIIFIFILRETLDIKNALAFIIAFVLELSFATLLIEVFG